MNASTHGDARSWGRVRTYLSGSAAVMMHEREETRHNQGSAHRCGAPTSVTTSLRRSTTWAVGAVRFGGDSSLRSEKQPRMAKSPVVPTWHNRPVVIALRPRRS